MPPGAVATAHMGGAGSSGDSAGAVTSFGRTPALGLAPTHPFPPGAVIAFRVPKQTLCWVAIVNEDTLIWGVSDRE